ncbi:MAG: CPBP family intramembrane metalloprotease [Bacteroidetes bacterium]|nr:MAG: CPBP family intramembrane metalloprotease [Bacteroidota bacterium]
MLVLWFSVKFIHKRDPKTMINPSGRINWNKVFFGFSLWLLLTACVEVIFYFLDPGSYSLQFEPGPFIVLLVISLLLFPLQTSFEEILFRGYLMQGLGLLTRRPWVPLLLTSVSFGLMHYMNPEVQEFGAGWAMSYYIGVGLFLGLITLLDDGLELALGVHAATNIYSALFVTFDSSAVQTPAIFKAAEVHIEWTLAGLIAAAVVFVFLSSKKYGWNDWSRWLRSPESENDDFLNA